jgi:hypothetical protein
MSWSGVDLEKMTDDGVDVDFYKLRISVTQDCPYLLSLPLVVLCPRTRTDQEVVRVTAYASLLVRTTPSLFVAFGISCTLHVCHQ